MSAKLELQRKASKIFAAMKRDPRDDWNIPDVAVVCSGFGLDCKPPTQGAQSHYIVSHPVIDGLLPVPARRRIKPIYIMLFIEMIESLEQR